MLLRVRPILSRLRKHQSVANFCVGTALGSPKNASSSSKGKSSPENQGYVVSFLVNSIGLSAANANCASKTLRFDALDKPIAVLNFLEKQGFSKTQVAEIVRKKPRLLLAKPDKSLLPKIEFFLHSAGIQKKDALTILSRHPHILARSVKHRLSPVYNYLKDIIGTEKTQDLLGNGHWIFGLDPKNRLIPNVDYLRKVGVPIDYIKFAIVYYERIFSLKPVEFREVVDEVKQMDVDPMKTKFIIAIRARAGKRNLAVWDKCYGVYSNWGWSKDDIFLAFRKHPNCMTLSDKNISATLDFLVNKLGRDARSVAHCPTLLLYNLDKRIIPRCSIVHLLSSKGLVKKDWSLASVLCPTEKHFLERYVTKYAEEVPLIYDIYQEKLGSSSKLLKSVQQC